MSRSAPSYSKLKLLLSLFIVVSVSVSARAEVGEGINVWYGGLTYGSLKNNIIVPKQVIGEHDRFFEARLIGGAQEYGQSSFEFNDATQGYKVFVGVSASERWDWEGGFIDFGETTSVFTTSDVVGGSFLQSFYHSTSDLKAMFLHVQYRFPFEIVDGWSPLEVVPRLGIMGWNSKVESTFSTDDSNVEKRSVDFNEKGTDEYYGIGISYDVTSGVRARIDYDHYVFASTDADMVSLTVDFLVPRIPYVFW